MFKSFGAAGRLFGVAGAEHRPHASQEDLRLVRLGDEIVCAGVEPVNLLCGRVGGRHDDGGNGGQPRIVAHAAQHFQAVYARHHQVEQHQPYGIIALQRCFETRQGFCAGGSRADVMAILGQDVFHEPDRIRVVVYDEEVNGQGALSVHHRKL